MTSSPAYAGRPRFDIGEIVREHRAALEAQQRLSPEQRRMLTNVGHCRTAALGGHLDVCLSCGYEHPSYNSCRARTCPKCSMLTQQEWVEDWAARQLDAGHFHVVFTIPAQLRPLAKFAPRVVYGALLTAASDTLRDLAASKLDAVLGITMVLHTWTRDLRFHPHVHAIVTAGGLSLDRTKWQPCDRKYLFANQVMSKLFRGKMLAILNREYRKSSFRGFEPFEDPEGFDALMRRLPRKGWNVYAKAPFGKSQYVLSYLGRYTHRVGIANSRLLDVSAERVTFRTRGQGVASMTPVEFLRRFVQHVLPDGFHKIRHYGLYASASKKNRDLARSLLGMPPSARPARATLAERVLAATGRDIRRCPRCGALLECRPLAPSVAQARAPPPSGFSPRAA